MQILSYVHFFLNAIEKVANKLETTMLGVKNSTRDQSVIKELDSMLSGLHIQFSCISSIEKALENVTDNSIAAACNLQLARRDTVLKNLAPDLNEHDFNRLRRTGFKSHDLFCPTVLTEVEKKIKNLPRGLGRTISPHSVLKESQMTDLLASISPVLHRRIFVTRTHLPSKNQASTLLSLPEEVEVSVVAHHGGRLQYFWQVWENLYCHPRVVQILRWGYRFLLQSNPPMSVYPTIQSGYNRQEKHGYLQDCVLQMLQKDAIYHLKDCTTPGFYSRIYLVPKPGKKWRPVINLSVLNSYMTIPTFKMETAEIIRNSLTKGE